MSEHSEQVALFEWAAWNTPRLPELALLFATFKRGQALASLPRLFEGQSGRQQARGA